MSIVLLALALPSFAEQVDAFANLRNYFGPEDDSPSYHVINAYLNSEITVEEAINRIAEPIEEQYTTADHGRKLADSAKRDETYEGYSTEGYLWELYYGFLHAALCHMVRGSECMPHTGACPCCVSVMDNRKQFGSSKHNHKLATMPLL